MGDDQNLSDSTPTMPFEAFWEWVVAHPNCILRAGTKDAVLFDDEDFHWHFTTEGPTNLLVQVIRGKRLVGEMLIPRQEIAFVQGVLGDHDGEFVFELVSGEETTPSALYFFVLTHGYQTLDDVDQRRVH